jgi:hypothetical protein
MSTINKIKIEFLASMSISFLTIASSYASPVIGFNAGYIIDDAVFTNTNTMNTAQIQNFLNSKVPICDTNGTLPASDFGRPDLTHAQYAANMGWQSPPYICLKDFSENGINSAQIIFNTAQQFRINPQVLIILLQKEQGLVTDTWPVSSQYRSATGYGCPDTAACDSDYYGFTNQVTWAARMFRSILNESPTWYSPYVLGNNYIQYSPNSSCGGSVVNIQNRSTQALYNYTPYQPNQAALDAGYGSVNCGAYGNRNFYLYFTGWFGSTKIYDPYGWSVAKTASNSATYLIIGNTKRWIPSGEIYNDWNLSVRLTETVSQEYLDSIPTLPPLGRLGYYNNKYYYIANGKKYWLSNESLIQAWGQKNNTAIAAPAYVAISTIPDAGEATYYISLPSENKVARLIDGKAYTINAVDVDRWMANPTELSSIAFNEIEPTANLDYRIIVDGIKYLVDRGKILKINNVDILRDYGQSNSIFVEVPNSILSNIAALNLNPIVTIDNSNEWFLLRGGVKYYLPTANHAAAWNIHDKPVNISSRLAESLTNSHAPLPIIAQDSSNNKIYLMDGKKHELNNTVKDAFLAPGSTMPIFSHDYFSTIETGSNINSPIFMTPKKDIYTVDSGSIYHIPNGYVLNGLGYPRKYSIDNISENILNTSMSKISTINMFIKINSDYYFMQDGNIFPINHNSIMDWSTGQSIPSFNSNNLSNRFDIQNSSILKNFINENGKNYIISGGTAYDVTNTGSSLLPQNESWIPLSIFGINRQSNDSIVVKSKDDSDGRIFIITNGAKQHILSGDVLSSYLKNNTIKILKMSPQIIETYRQINGGIDVSPVIYSSTGGLKILDSTGGFYSLPDSTTANSFIEGNQINQLDEYNYARYSVYSGSISRLVRDPNGKVYWIESGKKRWITNGIAIRPYLTNKITDLSWNIINWLPTGNAIE